MEQFEFLVIPVVEVDLAPATIVETTIDKTGPPGPPGLDGETADTQIITDHISNAVNPHGASVSQDILTVKSPRVQTTAIANAHTAMEISFADRSAVAYNVTGMPYFIVSDIASGQRVSISLYCDGSQRSASWAGVNRWLGGIPTLSANKLTVVTLFNDGVNVIGAWGTQN